jgi:hypothetical protein
VSPITERQEYLIEIIPPYSILQCRRADIVESDGIEVSRSYHRHVRVPGDDMTSEPAEMQEAALVAWTPEVVAAYQAQLSTDPEPAGPQHDYMAFWDALLVSSVYQTIRSQALTTPAVLVACTEFIAAIGDAKIGRPNVPAVQTCIDYLLAAATLSEAELAEMQSLLEAGHLESVYTLSAPV